MEEVVLMYNWEVPPSRREERNDADEHPIFGTYKWPPKEEGE
jgi:hypothetical protein